MNELDTIFKLIENAALSTQNKQDFIDLIKKYKIKKSDFSSHIAKAIALLSAKNALSNEALAAIVEKPEQAMHLAQHFIKLKEEHLHLEQTERDNARQLEEQKIAQEKEQLAKEQLAKNQLEKEKEKEIEKAKKLEAEKKELETLKKPLISEIDQAILNLEEMKPSSHINKMIAELKMLKKDIEELKNITEIEKNILDQLKARTKNITTDLKGERNEISNLLKFIALLEKSYNLNEEADLGSPRKKAPRKMSPLKTRPELRPPNL